MSCCCGPYYLGGKIFWNETDCELRKWHLSRKKLKTDHLPNPVANSALFYNQKDLNSLIFLLNFCNLFEPAISPYLFLTASWWSQRCAEQGSVGVRRRNQPHSASRRGRGEYFVKLWEQRIAKLRYLVTLFPFKMISLQNIDPWKEDREQAAKTHQTLGVSRWS